MKVLLRTIIVLVPLTSCAHLEETGDRINRLKRIADPNRIPFPAEFRVTPPELLPIPDTNIPPAETPPL
jgi:hypothetical protein